MIAFGTRRPGTKQAVREPGFYSRLEKGMPGDFSGAENLWKITAQTEISQTMAIIIKKMVKIRSLCLFLF